jgi:hypothetical protein
MDNPKNTLPGLRTGAPPAQKPARPTQKTALPGRRPAEKPPNFHYFCPSREFFGRFLLFILEFP